MNVDSTQNIISFCTGYGGIELGLRQAGLNVRAVAYVEIEAYAVANLVAKIEKGQMDAAPVWTDIKTFDGQPFHGKVHGIIGGYPCQPFSNAGKRRGTEDPRHLWPYIREHVRTVRPVWCFFENVSGHLNLGFNEVHQSLRDMGYAVEAGLFTAAEVGASFYGERLFILAATDGVRELQPQRGKQDEWRRADNRSETTPTMAEAKGERLQARRSAIGAEQTRARLTNCCADVRGVAWQDCEQHEWEQPREIYIKPRMGRAADVCPNWHDRIRMLGNGVNPAQAAKAFTILLERLNGKTRTK